MRVLGQFTIPANLYNVYVPSYHLIFFLGVAMNVIVHAGFLLSRRPNNYVTSKEITIKCVNK